MKLKLAISALFLVVSCPPYSDAQILGPGPAPVPNLANCAKVAQNYGQIVSYLNADDGLIWYTLAPAISMSRTIPEFEYWLGQVLQLERQRMDFLASCQSVPPPSCQPGTYTPAATTPDDVGTTVLAFDAAQGGSYIQGLFAIPPPKKAVDPVAALNAYYTNTAGAYCTLFAYAVHPIVIHGLKSPVLGSDSPTTSEEFNKAAAEFSQAPELPANWPKTDAEALKAARNVTSISIPLGALGEHVAEQEAASKK